MAPLIQFRATDAEQEKVTADAAAAGFSGVSAYIRDRVGLPPAKEGRPAGWRKVEQQPPAPAAPQDPLPTKKARRKAGKRPRSGAASDSR